MNRLNSSDARHQPGSLTRPVSRPLMSIMTEPIGSARAAPTASYAHSGSWRCFFNTQNERQASWKEGLIFMAAIVAGKNGRAGGNAMDRQDCRRNASPGGLFF